MKKQFPVIVILLVTLFMFTSCNKEGVYNPKEKIQKIYCSYDENSESSKQLEQVWTWDGNLLQKIDYHDNYGVYFTAKYHYDKKRISRIDWGDDEGDYIFTFVYSGSTLDKVTIKEREDNVEVGYIQYRHKGNKIVEEKLFSIGERLEFGMPPKKNPLRLFVSESALYPLSKIVRKRNVKSDEVSLVFTVSYEYKDDNVAKSTMTFASEEQMDEYVSIEEFSHDKNSNPFYKLHATSFQSDDNIAVQLSKNNVTKKRGSFMLKVNGVVVGQSEENNMTYTYKYDGKFPIERENTRNNDGDSDRSTTYFEY